jgi:hypothetical protein
MLRFYVIYLLFAVPALLVFGVLMDKNPEKLHRLTQLPFKDMPSTNGILFGVVLIACLSGVCWLILATEP